MSIVGFSFSKITAERKDGKLNKMKVDNNASIKNVEKVPLALGATENVLKISFNFETTYEPGIGKINLEGYLLYLQPEDKMNELAAQWKKEKKMPKEVMTGIMNNVLSKCSVETVLLSKELNLPPSIPVPRVALK